MKKPVISDDVSQVPHLRLVKIAHFHGDLKTATTADGFTVNRVESIYFPEHGLVKCAPYDNHFIFDDPGFHKKGIRWKGRWTPMCSCGSPAVIVGYQVYRNDASPTTSAESTIPGEMIVCYSHATYGKHADGST